MNQPKKEIPNNDYISKGLTTLIMIGAIFLIMIILLWILLLPFWGCASTISATTLTKTKTSVPSLLVKNTSNGAVTLVWNANTESNLAGYKLSYGTTSGNYSTQIDVGNVTNKIVSGLSNGLTYYFAVKAYNTAAMISPFSNEVSYTLPLVPSTPTPTATIPPVAFSVSGRVFYCTSTVPIPIQNVSLNLLSGSTSTDVLGYYLITLNGANTITPTKNALLPGSAGIDTIDAIATNLHFLNILPFPPGSCQLVAADVNEDGKINTIDVLAIVKFYLGQSQAINSHIGKYKFCPLNRTYTNSDSNSTNQDYDVLVLGDVVAPFVERSNDNINLPVSNRSAQSTVPIPTIILPKVNQLINNSVAKVNVTTIRTPNNLIGFQGDIIFDSTVIDFQDPPIQKAGLTKNNWNILGRVLPGKGIFRTLRISAYSNDSTPLKGPGTLFELRIAAIHNITLTQDTLTPKACELCLHDNFLFIDSKLNTHLSGY